MNHKNDDLHTMRHSLAHIMAAAIQRIWPETKFGIGPVIEDGFYYDVDPGVTITEEDLPKIEAEMRKIIDEDYPFERLELNIDEAIRWAKEHNQPYKEELLRDLKQKGTTFVNELDGEALGVDSSDEPQTIDNVTFYKSGEFVDLCRGPHVASTGKVGAFKLHKVAGAYWRGDEKRPQLQRIYGWGFPTQEELEEYIAKIEEAKLRDHRVIGKKLGLFTFSDLVGSGLPLFGPKGAWLRELLGRYSQQLRENKGYQRVWIPHLTKTDLYKKSGHWDKFKEELFLVTSQQTSDELVIKPMNCPHHTRIYVAEQRSYKDLPIKYMENTTVYRDEKSGELHGLSRVRSITQDDCHVFCREEQIEEAVGELIDVALQMYKELGLELKFRLGLRDESEAYLGDQALWELAQKQLETVAKSKKIDFYSTVGDAAFYGPKLDFIAVDALKREWQVATIQLDFIQPRRLDLAYIDENSQTKVPVMIHSALLGSIERFLSIYIEHTSGEFPFWLAPEQVRILTLNDSLGEYVEEIERILKATVLMEPLKYNEIRFTLDDRNISLGKKVRDAETEKVPVILIVGPKDEKAQIVSVRTKNGEDKVGLADLESWLHERR